MTSLKGRYGPWALLVGGSEGIGDHLARLLAADGINIVLVARKADALAETAARVRQAFGVEVRTLSLDVGREDMLERIREVTDGLEVGFLAHNVGGGASFGAFVDAPLEAVLTPIRANPLALTRLAHHFGKGMADRGRGAILVIGSLAGNAGSYFIAGYSAAKAFNQVLIEALWAELKPRGVDVLAFPVGSADTPSRQRSGVKDDPSLVVATPEGIARQALEQLPNGPVYVTPETRAYFEALCNPARDKAAELQRDLLLGMMPNAADA